MHTCPLLRASVESRKLAIHRTPPARTNAGARRWPALWASLLGLVGWRALRDVLSAIPDSNDDFGLF